MNECPNCKRLQKELDAVKKELADLKLEIARHLKNSSTSSKPPSSDIVKPKKEKDAKPGRRKKRNKGGQKGHPKHERPAFEDHEIDETRAYHLVSCPSCDGKDLEIIHKKPRVIQQVELVSKPVIVTEHRAYKVWCRTCQTFHLTPLPPEIVKAGLCGPHLTALVAFMKGCCHASYSTIRKFLRDVMKITISRSQLTRLVYKVSGSLKDPYQQLLDLLESEKHLNVDETGHKNNGKRMYTWCFRAALYTLFKIDKHRSSDVLIEVLGKEFNGILGCDYFSAYRKYMGDFDILVQFCLAHLIRDVKYLTTLPCKVTQNYGHRVLEKLKALFKVIHRQDSYSSEKYFQRALERAKDNLIKKALQGPPGTTAQNIVKRFKDHGDAYFTFITTPGIDPTNNIAEQAIRFVVIDRTVTQGTRSIKGQEWSERIWTVMATTAQQGRSAFNFLVQAVQAWMSGTPPPSLIPNST